MANEQQELAKVAQQAVSIGHDLMQSHKPADVIEKTDRDIVTDLDTRIEREIRTYLHKHTPDIGFLGEEKGAYGGNGPGRWVLDPIDGTANFVQGIPLCAVSLALVCDNRPIIRVINAPFLGMHYQAVEGHGAYGNGTKLQCSDTTNLARAIVSIGDDATGNDATAKNAARLRLTMLLAERVERVRMLGSAAIDFAWIAEGRTDGAIVLGAKVWDSAAGTIIARESGAKVVDASGKPVHTDVNRHNCRKPHLTGSLLELTQHDNALSRWPNNQVSSS